MPRRTRWHRSEGTGDSTSGDEPSNSIEQMVHDLPDAELRVLIESRMHHDRGLHDALKHAWRLQQAASDSSALATTLGRQLDEILSATPNGRNMQESAAHVGILNVWVDDVERWLIPRAPASAAALAERLLASEPVLYNELFDVDWEISLMIQSGCRLWLKAARACGNDDGRWTTRLAELYRGDGYGIRDTLVSEARDLIDALALRPVEE